MVSFLYFFFVLASYYVIRPLRDQLAVEAGSQALLLFFSVTFLVTILMTQLFSWAVSKWPRRVIIPIVNLFFILGQLAFIPIWRNHDWISIQHLGLIFFVWVSVFNLFVVSVFWTFMTDIWDDDQARLLFPYISLGGTAGAIIGPLITKSLVSIIGLAPLLAVSAALLGGAIFCILYLSHWATKHSVNRFKKGSEAPLGGGVLDGLKQIFNNAFMASMCAMMLLSDAIGTIAYVLVTDYSGMAFKDNPIAQTKFAADMDFISNILQIAIQLTITSWLLVRFGSGFIFALCSAIIVVASLTMVFLPDPYHPIIGMFPIAALILIISRALAHSMIQSARESLYTMVARDLRYKGKNAVDTVVWRAGDVMSLLSIQALRTLGMSVSGFGVIWAVVAALSGIIGWKISKRTEAGEFE